MREISLDDAAMQLAFALLILAVRSILSQLKGLPSMARFTS
jgi:hypothetical protein